MPSRVFFYLFGRAILHPNAHTNTELEEDHTDEQQIGYREEPRDGQKSMKAYVTTENHHGGETRINGE